MEHPVSGGYDSLWFSNPFPRKSRNLSWPIAGSEKERNQSLSDGSMRVLFVVHDLSFADHLAIAYLSSIAKELRHETFFCSLDTENLTAAVEHIKPDVVGYSVNVIGFDRTVEAHRKAAGVHSFTSIMGGPHPTFSPETFPQSGMDAYCIGEGEYAFRDFLVRLARGDSFDDVPNLITKNCSNPPRPLIANLDDLPLPDRDLVISHSFLQTTSKKTFYATRGCPFQCTYCCNNFYRQLYLHKGKAVRRFSVERVLREIEDVRRKYRMDFVKFGDDCFVVKADAWLEEFTEKYSKRIGVPFNCYLRLDLVDDAMLGLLKRAGCFSVHLSVDSTSPYVRDAVLQRHMRSDNEDIARRLRLIRHYRIATWVNYMLAVPGSTLQDDLDTIGLSKRGKVTYAAYSTTVPMKGTQLYNSCAAQGILDVSAYHGDMSGCTEKSALSCFDEKEKKVRYNVFLLGALVAKLPWPLDHLGILIIKGIPPNWIFKKVNEWLHYYYVEHRIFRLRPDGQKGTRQIKRAAPGKGGGLGLTNPQTGVP